MSNKVQHNLAILRRANTDIPSYRRRNQRKPSRLYSALSTDQIRSILDVCSFPSSLILQLGPRFIRKAIWRSVEIPVLVERQTRHDEITVLMLNPRRNAKSSP